MPGARGVGAEGLSPFGPAVFDGVEEEETGFGRFRRLGVLLPPNPSTRSTLLAGGTMPGVTGQVTRHTSPQGDPLCGQEACFMRGAQW